MVVSFEKKNRGYPLKNLFLTLGGFILCQSPEGAVTNPDLVKLVLEIGG
jgi:hypothetical protein